MRTWLVCCETLKQWPKSPDTVHHPEQVLSDIGCGFSLPSPICSPLPPVTWGWVCSSHLDHGWTVSPQRTPVLSLWWQCSKKITPCSSPPPAWDCYSSRERNETHDGKVTYLKSHLLPRSAIHVPDGLFIYVFWRWFISLIVLYKL